jgi:hypothetical protein
VQIVVRRENNGVDRSADSMAFKLATAMHQHRPETLGGIIGEIRPHMVKVEHRAGHRVHQDSAVEYVSMFVRFPTRRPHRLVVSGNLPQWCRRFPPSLSSRPSG